MSRKRIEKRVGQLFTEIKQVRNETSGPPEHKPLGPSGAQVDAQPSTSVEIEEYHPQISGQVQAESVPAILDQTLRDDERKEAAIVSASQPVSERERAGGIFQRFSRWFKRRRHLADGETDVTLDDAQVGQRLVGEVPPEPSKTPIIPRPIRMRRRREKSQPDQPVPAEGEPSAPISQPRQVNEPDFEKVRPVALEEYEPPASIPRKPSVSSRLRIWFKHLSYGQRVLLFSSVFVFTAIIFFFTVLFKPVTPIVAPPVSKLDPSIPIPQVVILPDNQTFELSLGGVTDGIWKPQEAEWLIDTEVPRWLSLPWSKDLEAAVLLYKENDPVQLRMNNGDIIVYRFQAVEEIAREELYLFHAYTADLMIMLFKPRGETCLVLVSIP